MNEILEKEIKIAKNADRYLVLDKGRLIEEIARYFFELGINVRNQSSLPSNLDEAAVEQANLIYPENIRMGHVAKHDVNLLTRRGFIKGFKAGAKWMATDHGVILKECTNKGRALLIDLDLVK